MNRSVKQFCKTGLIILGVFLVLWVGITAFAAGLSPDALILTGILFLLPLSVSVLLQFGCAYFSGRILIRLIPLFLLLIYGVCTIGMASGLWKMTWLFGTSGGFLDFRLLVAVCLIICFAAGIVLGWLLYAVFRRREKKQTQA